MRNFQLLFITCLCALLSMSSCMQNKMHMDTGEGLIALQKKIRKLAGENRQIDSYSIYSVRGTSATRSIEISASDQKEKDPTVINILYISQNDYSLQTITSTPYRGTHDFQPNLKIVRDHLQDMQEQIPSNYSYKYIQQIDYKSSSEGWEYILTVNIYPTVQGYTTESKYVLVEEVEENVNQFISDFKGNQITEANITDYLMKFRINETGIELLKAEKEKQ